MKTRYGAMLGVVWMVGCPPTPLDPIVTAGDTAGETNAGTGGDTGGGTLTGGEPTTTLPDATETANTVTTETTETGTTEATDLETTGTTSADVTGTTGAGEGETRGVDVPVGCEVVEFADPAVEAAVRSWLEQPEGPLLGEDVAGVASVGPIDINSLGGLECAVGLDSLFPSGGALTDLSPLAGLPALRWLTLWDVQVTDLSPLAGLPALETFNLQGGAVPDLGPLAEIESLAEVSVTYVGLADISPLAGAQGLERVTVDGTSVVDLGPLAGLTELNWVSASDTAVVDLSPLATLPKLAQVRLDDTGVVDLGPLAGKPIRMLVVRNGGVVDVAPLATFTVSPFYIDLSGNAIVDLAPLLAEDWPAKERCGDVYFNDNPLSAASKQVVFPALCEQLGVGVHVAGDSCLMGSCVTP